MTTHRTESFPPLGRLPLAREDVDRGCEVRGQDSWLPSLWERAETRVLWLHGGLAPVSNGQLVLCPVPDDAVPPAERDETTVYLGRSLEHSNGNNGNKGEKGEDATAAAELVLLIADSAGPAPRLEHPELAGEPISADDVAWLGVRDVAAALSSRDAGIFVEAVAVANWHARNGFCPRCGAPTRITTSGWVRVCPQDGSEHFPRTDPAVIVAITDPDDRILLGNNAQWGPTRFSTLAGFVEPGESLEAAVKREIYEESHLRVHSPRYLGSQPWPFPQSLMLGFTARTDAPEEAISDGEEVLTVRWFTRAELREQVERGDVVIPGASSIARALLEHWYGGSLPEPRTLQN